VVKIPGYSKSSGASLVSTDDGFELNQNRQDSSKPYSSLDQYVRLAKDISAVQNAQESLVKDFDKTKESLVKDFDKTKESLVKDFDKTKEEVKLEIKTVKDEIKSVQIKSVEMLGVFVSLFTFVSLDFSVLKNSVSLGTSVSLILIAAGLLLSFLLIMHFILFQESDTKFFSKTFLLWIVIVFLISFGVFFLKVSLAKYDNSWSTNTQNNFNLEISNGSKK
jgi:hypothetical protein